MNKLTDNTYRFLLALFFFVFANMTHADLTEPDNFLTRDLPEAGSLDPELVEINYFKKVVSEPYGDLDPDLITNPAKMTLGQWKTFNGFNHPKLITSQAYYYNSADLGLARDMTCVKQNTVFLQNDPDFWIQRLKQRGKTSMACYVSNRGFIGGTKEDGFAGIIDGTTPFATVAMEFWADSSLEFNKVRFFVFGADPDGNNNPDNGRLVYLNGQLKNGNFHTGAVGEASSIKLDNGTGHSQPGICLSCHGGEINADGEVTGAHFLPFDIASMEFPDTKIQQSSGIFKPRNEAIDAFDAMNSWIFWAEGLGNPMNIDEDRDITKKPLVKFIRESYGYSNLVQQFIGHQPELLEMDDNHVPEAFEGQTQLFRNIYKPYCQSCHLSSSFTLIGSNFPSAYFCNKAFAGAVMPHAEINEKNLKRHADFVAQHLYNIDGTECSGLDTLIDFDAPYVEAPVIFTDPTRGVPFIGISRILDTDGNEVEDSVENVRKRTLQLPANLDSAVIIVEERDYDFNGSNINNSSIDSLSFSYVAESIPSEINVKFYTPTGIKEGRFFGYSSQGEFVKVVFSPDEIGYQNLPADAYKAEITLRRNGLNAGTIVELDDLQVNFTVNGRYQNTRIADFEDESLLDTFGPDYISELTMDPNISYYSDAAKACVANRVNAGVETNSWVTAGINKTARDPGRFSFVTSPFTCARDLQVFTWPVGGEAGKMANVSFDWRNNENATLNLIIKNADGSYDFTDLSTYTQATDFGRFHTTAQADASLIIYYSYQSTSSEFDSDGGAIDNLRVVYQ